MHGSQPNALDACNPSPAGLLVGSTSPEECSFFAVDLHSPMTDKNEDNQPAAVA